MIFLTLPRLGKSYAALSRSDIIDSEDIFPIDKSFESISSFTANMSKFSGDVDHHLVTSLALRDFDIQPDVAVGMSGYDYLAHLRLTGQHEYISERSESAVIQIAEQFFQTHSLRGYYVNLTTGGFLSDIIDTYQYTL
jgi:hypothetical protein